MTSLEEDMPRMRACLSEAAKRGTPAPGAGVPRLWIRVYRSASCRPMLLLLRRVSSGRIVRSPLPPELASQRLAGCITPEERIPERPVGEGVEDSTVGEGVLHRGIGQEA